MVRIEGMSDSTEPDGLYEKYRVFREPTRDSQGNGVPEHPVPIDPPLWSSFFMNRAGEIVPLLEELEEITDEFLFVLKPKTDPHAQVALAAYAWSVKREKPLLHVDLLDILREWKWDEGDDGDDGDLRDLASP